MGLKIYFCGSICAGRVDANLYARLIEELKKYGTVLTEHVGDLNLLEKGDPFGNLALLPPANAFTGR